MQDVDVPQSRQRNKTVVSSWGLAVILLLGLLIQVLFIRVVLTLNVSETLGICMVSLVQMSVGVRKVRKMTSLSVLILFQ